MGGPRQDQYPGPGLKVYHQNQNICSNIFSNIFPLLSWIFTILEATCPQRAAATTASLLVNRVTWPIEFRPSKVFEITKRTTSINPIYSIYPGFRASQVFEITNQITSIYTWLEMPCKENYIPCTICGNIQNRCYLHITQILFTFLRLSYFS